MGAPLRSFSAIVILAKRAELVEQAAYLYCRRKSILSNEAPAAYGIC